MSGIEVAGGGCGIIEGESAAKPLRAHTRRRFQAFVRSSGLLILLQFAAGRRLALFVSVAAPNLGSFLFLLESTVRFCVSMRFCFFRLWIRTADSERRVVSSSAPATRCLIVC